MYGVAGCLDFPELNGLSIVLNEESPQVAMVTSSTSETSLFMDFAGVERYSNISESACDPESMSVQFVRSIIDAESLSDDSADALKDVLAGVRGTFQIVCSGVPSIIRLNLTDFLVRGVVVERRIDLRWILTRRLRRGDKLCFGDFGETCMLPLRRTVMF